MLTWMMTLNYFINRFIQNIIIYANGLQISFLFPELQYLGDVLNTEALWQTPEIKNIPLFHGL